MVRFAVSSWSLDGLLRSGVPLLELPAQLQQHGLAVLELCHFHLPTTEPAYLQALRERLAAADIQLFSPPTATSPWLAPTRIALTGITTVLGANPKRVLR